MAVNQAFCKAYNTLFNSDIEHQNEVILCSLRGDQLVKLCKKYMSNRLTESSLRHFYLCKKIKYYAIGFLIGFAFFRITNLFILQLWH